ncbi:MAG: ADP-heptose synthase [Lentisphaerae bacterium GWF2_45_14]|nr:MAG: ADP-heptose synthase [Lentisphaerae bacterium GWF2_45_14]
MKKLHEDSLKALELISNLRKQKRNAKFVFVSGNFNIVHPGHLRLLRFAKECGNILVVGVYADSLDTGAVLPENNRLEGVDSISWVDFAFILRDSSQSFISALKPDIIVKGQEHEAHCNPEQAAVDAYGGKLLFCSGDLTFSSIDLLRKELMVSSSDGFDLQQEFAERHSFSIDSLTEQIGKMKNLNVVVIGDLIIDEYITCEALGMSREDPTIVVSPIVSDKFVGGAGIVAAHASGLGGKVSFFTVCGNDENSIYAENELKNHGVSVHFYRDESRPTIHKQRFRAENKTLLRVNHLKQHTINKSLTSLIIKELERVLESTELLIFSDFNYGMLHQELVDHVISIARKKNIMMVADSQSSSQTGDVARFKYMNFLKPTEHEARLSVRDHNSGLVILAEKLRKMAKCKNILMTLGEEGVLIHAQTSQKNKWMTDQLRPMNLAPRDVAGAGDSFLTCSSMAMASGSSIWQSAYLGSLAAACQVSRIGNIPLSKDDLRRKI